MTRVLFFVLIGCFLGACQSEDNSFWQSLESRSDDNKKRKGRVVVQKTNSSFQGDDCASCLAQIDTLTLRWANFYRDENNLSCTFENILPIQLEVIDFQGNSCFTSIDPNSMKVVYSRNNQQTPPFDLLFRQSANVSIPFQCNNLAFFGEKGRIILTYEYRDCEDVYEASTDTLSFDLGCPNATDDFISYSQQAAPELAGYNFLPSYSLATYDLQLEHNILIRPNSRILLKVCDPSEGFIRAGGADNSGIIKVEKGAFFKATGVKD